MRLIILLIFFLLTAGSFPASSQIYKNKNQSVEARVQDLLRRMTPEEKFFQLFMVAGDPDKADTSRYKNGIFGVQLSQSKNETKESLAIRINSIQKYFLEKTRLGIPIIPFEEALHGLVRPGTTVFPQAIALAATWDTTLMHRVANAIAEGTKQRGIRQILSPVINIASDVRWGRTEETYGEDPFLTSVMSTSFVKAFEQKGIITTPKHFIANVGDGGRDSYPINVNERSLEEIYFPPFKTALKEGGSGSIMTAYNSLNGEACSANSWLLLKKLKEEWGFRGFVISDANAVGGEVVLHNTAKDYAESGMHAINNGLDVIFQTDYDHYKLFIPAFLDGRIDSNRINDAVARVLKAKFELGLFDDPYVSVIDTATLTAEHKAIAKQAALESIILLKNAPVPGLYKNILPLSRNIRSIAVIGVDAMAGRLGGYSAPGENKISILDGLIQKTGNAIKINYEPGCGRDKSEYVVIPSKNLTWHNQQGLHGEYFDNINFNGLPVSERTDKQLDFRWTLSAPVSSLSKDFYSVRWSGQLIAPLTGKFKIGLEGNDGYRLFINGKLVVDNWQKQSYHVSMANYSFEKNKRYSLRIDFYETTGNATIKLIWNLGVDNEWKQKIQQAAAVAKNSEIAIVAVGINEGEFHDRASLSLPGHQEELIDAIAATGKPVIVVLVGGSAVTMNNWINKVPAIIEVWYPGEQGGSALADILFGDYDPAGRLPITFPISEGQLPLVYNHKPTGRGDDYNDLTGLPLFPFGYGLSYTNFEYSDINFGKNTINRSESTTVSFTLKNTGIMDGDEVVQLYIRDKLSSVVRPVIELKGFQRVHLKKGESTRISLVITPEMLSMLDKDLKRVVEAGEFEVMVGGSSRDIRLKKSLFVAN